MGLQEESVRGAAERLSLTLLAVSHAFGRLRELLGDPLLVRAGQRLVPTPRAVALRDRVREAVESGLSILQDRAFDDLANAQRTFVIRANDSTICVFGARLANLVQRGAPGIKLRFVGRPDEGMGALRDGLVYLDLGAVADIGPKMCSQNLLRSDFVCVVGSVTARTSARPGIGWTAKVSVLGSG